ncbi:hypothetical protein BGP_1636 [Beggiatoa sp. PS]|nr:hypothetical protein BGP_1636 [Beggiatoa sp. PS]
MKAILYSPDLGITSYKKFEINGVGCCYLFPENEDDFFLKDLLSLFYEQNDIVFLIPMSLTKKFLEWFEDLTGNSHSWKETDDSYFGDNGEAVKERIANINDNTNKVNFEGVLMSVIPIKDDALQVKMDAVADNDNEIDCVFVASVKSGTILRGTDENKVMETNRRFNAQMFGELS